MPCLQNEVKLQVIKILHCKKKTDHQNIFILMVFNTDAIKNTAYLPLKFYRRK